MANGWTLERRARQAELIRVGGRVLLGMLVQGAVLAFLYGPFNGSRPSGPSGPLCAATDVRGPDTSHSQSRCMN